MNQPALRDYARMIDYPVQKKLLSLLDGHHRGLSAGSSQEFLDMAEYKAGDDVGDIDWKSTARLSLPVVKRFEATAVLAVALGVDTGSNMGALAGGDVITGFAKRQVASELLRVIAWMVATHGDHLSLVAGNAVELKSMPARAGIGHVETLMRVADSASPTGPPPNFSRVLRRLSAEVRRRSLVVAVTDLMQIDEGVLLQLSRLSHRNEVAVLLVEDFDPTSALIEPLALVDVAGGSIPDFVERDEAVAAQWKMLRRIRWHGVAEQLDRLPLSYASVSKRADILPALIHVLGGGHRGGAT